MANPISEGIKRLRAQHKLTQTELATMAKIPRATLANMEGENSNPSISLVLKVAQALGVSVDDLITNKPSVHATEVLRKDMPIMHLDNGRFVSTKTSPISTQNLQVNDISMMPNCYSKGVPHPEGSYELFLCLEGSAMIEIQGEKFIIEAGNLLFFQGHLPHSYGNEGLKPVHGIAVVYMAK
ncbi:helix-turn-helix domain-containing protein [Thalassotalea sp. PLHSN55]|uniref:helix-turn-helix domain-containing protein n=1 Tax=Thalassotalea sp. PLHSN55 TaxID=3435888 RepID=UPI003F828BF9